MQVTKTTLKNGLRVLTIPMPSMESATVQISVDAGTRDEEKRVNGLAHFLEHMVFKGTKKYPSAKAISLAVDAIGAEINANTGKEGTAYYIKAWEKHLNLAFDLLSDFVRAPLLKPAEIEREKGVILQEIAMYEDLPMQKASEVFEEVLYPNSSLGWDILGTKGSVSKIVKKDFANYRDKLYWAENMVLAVAGKFEQSRILGLAEKYFGDLKRGKRAGKAGKRTQTNPAKSPQTKLKTQKTEQAHIVLGVRGNPLGHPDRYKEAVLVAILGGGMSSRLWTEIRERRGLAYYVRCDAGHHTDSGYLSARAGVKLEKVEEAIKVILEEYRKVSKVSQKELEKTKEYLKGHFTLSLEDTHGVADFFGEEELFKGKTRTVEEIIAGINSVTAEDIRQLARKFFQNSRLNLAIIGPYKDAQKFERLLRF